MPFDLFKEIKNDFKRETYEMKDLANLDNWVSFYFKHGRFPGSVNLTILLQTQLPTVIDPLSVEVSPIELYNKFGNGDAKSLLFKQLLHYFYIMEEKLPLQKSNGGMERKFKFSSFIKRK